MGLCIYTALVISTLISGTNSLTFSGCFTLAPGLLVPVDVAKLGWSDKLRLTSPDELQFCINHCVQKLQSYAAFESNGADMFCVCGTEAAFKSLGTPDHKKSQSSCSHSRWSLKTYVARGDVSPQYVGCYTEVADSTKMASSSHHWVDPWMMTPSFCIKYCEANGAAYANLRGGDTCTCGSSYAKYGRTSESKCDKPCVGSKGQKCGGHLAISVFSILSPEDILNPDSSFRTHGFLLSAPVKVPITLTLLKNLLVLQQASNDQVPNQNVKVIGDLLHRSQTLAGYITGMKIPFEDLIKSGGFGMSNAAETRKWLSSDFPPPLKIFADTIKRAHSFIDVDVKKVVDFVNIVSREAGPMNAATLQTLQNLKNYIDKGIQIVDVERSMKVVLSMVSASRSCLPSLTSKKDEMTRNLEMVSQYLISGPQGIKKYIQLLRNPLPASTTALTKVKPPTVDPQTWKASLTEMANRWESFVSKNGVKLYMLIQNKYSVVCPTVPPTINPNSVIGRRSTCQDETDVDFLKMVKRPGNNKAKADMEKFVKDNNMTFRNLRWSFFEEKLGGIFREFKTIQDYLVKTKTASPAAIKRLQQPFGVVSFYPNCISALSAMIEEVCHKTSKPTDSKVSILKC